MPEGCLIVGLSTDVTLERATKLKDIINEHLPDVEVIIITQCSTVLYLEQTP